MSTFLTILLALLGGVGGTIMWEGFVLRRRDRKSLARIIAAEIALNMALFKAQVHLRKTYPTTVESDFQVTRSVFDSVSKEVGIFSSDILEKILHFYFNVDQINRISTRFIDVQQNFEYNLNNEQKKKALGELSAYSEGIERLCKDGIVLGANTIVTLEKISGHIPSFTKVIDSDDIEDMVDEIYERNRSSKNRSNRKESNK